jgi:hypothetical protein
VDSHDESDNENENSTKPEVRKEISQAKEYSIHFF